MNECCNRVPETLIGAKQLIAYGLEITDFPAYLNIESENTSKFYVFKSDYSVKCNFWNFDHSGTFSQAGKEFIISRFQLLNYLDKLTTYEMILKKMNGTYESLYSTYTYKRLRDLDPKQWAVQLARECQVDAVFIVITYYSNQILPYWLDIINDFPETLMPKLYRYNLTLMKFNYIF